MTERFEIHPDFLKNSLEIINLSLSQVRLLNNKNFLWLILIPRKNNLKNNLRELVDLNFEDQILLLKEINLISQIFNKLKFKHIKNKKYPCNKINIASLGNLTPQLHIHIIARHEQDIAWPKAPFGLEELKYEAEELENLIRYLKQEIITN